MIKLTMVEKTIAAIINLLINNHFVYVFLPTEKPMHMANLKQNLNAVKKKY